MLFNKTIMSFLGVLLACSLNAQILKGFVFGADGEPLQGASLHWVNTTIGTISDENGAFEIDPGDLYDTRMAVSYVGYEPDTFIIVGQTYLEINLIASNTLEGIEIAGERSGTYTSSIDPIKTEVITQTELTKAACCDLAGCFETEASVEPSTTNIVTNAKELRILGLSGVYNQVLIDGFPLIKGLSYTYGISTIPGTLVDNIFVTKGANSVLQGYESISGQINVVPKKPEDTDKLLLNVFMNSFMEKQFNANYSHKWKKWSTLVAAHTTQPANKFDRDDDNFLDLPQLTRYSLFNKWNYGNPNKAGFSEQFAIRLVDEKRLGGQMNFDPEKDEGGTNNYGQTVSFSQYEYYSKFNYRFNDRHNIVLFSSAFRHDQLAYFGETAYDALQTSTYANLQYELNWKAHRLKTGLSYRYNDLSENISFSENILNRTFAGDYVKEERIPGLFAENTFYWQEDKIVLITGFRVDKHNDFGWKATPRALLKYKLADNTTARISAGTGWRTFNLFSENISLLASARDIIITESLQPEKAFNYGVNLVHKSYWEKMDASFSVDLYRTEFSNQIFPDYDTDPAKAFISNFTGTSISNGVQLEAGFRFFERMEAKFAYNYLDVYRMIDGSKYVLPFNAKHKVNTVFSYKPLHRRWHFDMNTHWYGEQNLANTSANPEEYQTADNSDPYTVVNMQFTKSWPLFDVYVGCENIFDFRQKQPILSWEDPFGPHFDTASVWGPTRGREFYLGVRFILE